MSKESRVINRIRNGLHLIFGFFFLISALPAAYGLWPLLTRGDEIRLEGTVIGREQSEMVDGSVITRVHALVLEFTDPAGQTRQARSADFSNLYTQANGTRMSFLYDPERPDTVRLDASWDGAVTAITVLPGLIFAVIILVLWWFSARLLRRLTTQAAKA
jgi:hypothetical protein